MQDVRRDLVNLEATYRADSEDVEAGREDNSEDERGSAAGFREHEREDGEDDG